MSTPPFIADQYIILNVAIQNSIEPSFTESEMVLDYIRVYQQGTSSKPRIHKMLVIHTLGLTETHILQVMTHLLIL